MSFEDKLKARIKDQIGELMSDEDLKKLVHGSMNTIFFAKRTNPKYSAYGYGQSEPPELEPLLHEIVKEVLKPSVTAAVNAWVKEHPEDVAKAVTDVMTQGVGAALVSAVSTMFHGDLLSLQSNIIQRLKQP